MQTERIEHNELIANRKAPGDNWILTSDPKNVIHTSLTEALEAFFNSTGFKGSYRLDPLDSKLYTINEHEYEIPVEKPKTYSFYGDVRQGL
jgi:hypothetical protein